MNLEEFIRRVPGGHHRTGEGGYRLLCPAHRDRIPSLSATAGADGRILLKCMAGCETEAVVRALDLRMCDLFPAPAPSGNGAKRRPKVDKRGPAVAEFIHCNQDGQPIYKKVRHEPGADGRIKDYLEWHFDGAGWKPGRGGITPPLYRLPEIMRERLVFLFESHTDVDRAVSMGLSATTSGGAGSWLDGYADALAGKDVCLIPDSDGPGAKFAALACASLSSKARSLKVISITPYPDFRRWADAGGTAEKLFELVESAQEWKPADGAEILDSMMAFIRRFVSLTEAQARAVALWVAHTHAFDAAVCTPYLAITSAEKESGKSRLLDVLQVLVENPWRTARVSAAVLVRKIDAKGPALLLDETDAAIASDKEYSEALRGLLNSGYQRGGCASLCVGQGSAITFKDFKTFAPKAIAGIGRLPDTVQSRSIPIRLIRAKRGEVPKFRRRDADGAKPIFSELSAWCSANLKALSDAQPAIPDALSDRQSDCCEPLIAIADAAGGGWPEESRKALIQLCTKAQADDDSIGVKLLADIKKFFFPIDDQGNPLASLERVSSSDLANALGEMEDRPWAEWGKSQKPITQPQLARQLSRYDVGPRTVRLPDGRRLKGYERVWFEELWALYLSPDSPSPSPVPPDSKRDTVTNQCLCGFEPLFQGVTQDACHASENAVSPNKNAGCHGVTVQKQGEGVKQAEKQPSKRNISGVMG